MKNRILDPDAGLMLKFAQGNNAAFDQILRKYKRLVINLAYRFIQNRAEAEDIAQEVFLRVYYSAKRYKPKAKFSTWIYKITANICINNLRSKKHLQIVSLNKPISTTGNEMITEMPDPTYIHPSANSEKKEINQLVKEAISSLPINQKMAVILQKYEGLSYREISEIMGCSIQAVDSLLQRAKQNLKRKLTPYFRKI
ncbi:MAG: sigma-70 family RNA polymerase sigma factor [Candidatus Aminicenantes bacterium]|nr:sigma-70 family RNA polymerase sigma factor [Candidatus Aminicenantes bacterium]